MRPKLATLMQHLKATNARLDRRLKAIEEEMRQVGEPEAVSVRLLREDLAALTETLPGHVNGADKAED
jgi:hypothetical protein